MSSHPSPTCTAALVAANRSNAKKSTGPKTDRGFSQLNSLKRGRYAHLFRSNLWRPPAATLISIGSTPKFSKLSAPRTAGNAKSVRKRTKKLMSRDFRVPARRFGRKPESGLESADRRAWTASRLLQNWGREGRGTPELRRAPGASLCQEISRLREWVDLLPQAPRGRLGRARTGG